MLAPSDRTKEALKDIIETVLRFLCAQVRHGRLGANDQFQTGNHIRQYSAVWPHRFQNLRPPCGEPGFGLRQELGNK